MKVKTSRAILFLSIFLLLSVNTIAQRNAPWMWQYHVEKDKESVLFNQFHNGTVYLDEITADKKQVLVAVDAKKGTIKWKTKLKEGVPKTFYSYISKIEFGIDVINILTRDRDLFVINQQNGKIIWQSQRRTDIDAFLVNIANDTKDLFTLGDEMGVSKVEGQSGREEWNFKRCWSLGFNSNNNLVVKNNTVVFPCGSGKLYGIDAQTGKEKWRINYGPGDINYLFESEGIIYIVVDSDHNENIIFQALSIADGKLLWEDKNIGKGKAQLNAFNANKETCFLYSKDYLIKFDVKTGKRLWIQQNRTAQNNYKKLFLTRKELIETNEKGWITSTSLENGQIVWKTQISEQNSDSFYVKSLAIVSDEIYLNAGQELIALGLKNGEVIWRIKSLATLKGSDKTGTLFFESAGAVITAISSFELNKIAKSKRESFFPPDPKNDSKSGFVLQDGYGTGRANGFGNANIAANRIVSLIKIENSKAYYLETYLKEKNSKIYEVDLDTGEKKIAIRGLESSFLSVPAIIGKIAFVYGVFKKENKGITAKIKYQKDSNAKQLFPTELWAIDLEKDEVLWTFNINLQMIAGINISKNRTFFLSNDSTIYALDEKGDLLWKKQPLNPGFNAFAKLSFSDGKVFYVNPLNSNKSILVALNSQNGEILWSLEKNFPIDIILAKDDLLFLGGRNGKVFAVEQNTGKEIWVEQLHSKAFDLKTEKDKLIVTTIGLTNWLISLNLRTGELFWERRFKGYGLDYIDEETIAGFSDGWYLDAQTGQRKSRLSIVNSHSNKILAIDKNSVIYLEQDDGKESKENHPSEAHQDLIKFDIKSNKILWSVAL